MAGCRRWRRQGAEGDLAFDDLLGHDALGEPPTVRQPSDPIVQIFFTSGTTGRPKAVTVPVNALAAFAP